MKTCTVCGLEKDGGNFYRSKQARDGLRPDCKECVGKRNSEWSRKNRNVNRGATKTWRQKNPERSRELIKDWYKRNPDAKKKYWVKRYNLKWGDFLSLVEMQNWECMICRTPLLERKDQKIDHDHSCCSRDSRSCGKCVRGILCNRCNYVLGLVKDDCNLLQNMIVYLRGFSEQF